MVAHAFITLGYFITLYYTGQESRVQGQPEPGTLVMVISDNWL